MSTAITTLISFAVMLMIAFTALHSTVNALGTRGEGHVAELGRLETSIRSDVVATGAATSTTVSGHSDVDLMLANRGATSYAVYDEWDVIVHYVPVNGIQNAVSLPYATSLEDNSWTIAAIYLDPATAAPEVQEQGLFNPEEEAVVRARIAPWAKTGTPAWAVLTPPEGPSIGIPFTNPTLHVVDRIDGAAYLYDAYGNHIDTMALDGSNTDTSGITAQGATVHVLDENSLEVYDYGATLSLLDTWALDSGNDTGSGITTDGVNIWTLDDGDDSAYKYDLDGSFISADPLAGGNGDARGITTDGNNIWVVDDEEDSAYKYDMDLDFIAESPLQALNLGSAGITTDGNNIWVVDRDADVVFTYDMDMTYESQFSLATGNNDADGLTLVPRY